MKAIAEFAIRRRWLVIAGWIVLIVAAQGIASAWAAPPTRTPSAFRTPRRRRSTNLLKAPASTTERGLRHGRHQEQGPPRSPARRAAAVGPRELCTSGDYVRADLHPVAVDRLLEERRGHRGRTRKLLNTSHGPTRPWSRSRWESNHYDARATSRMSSTVQEAAKSDSSGRVHRQRVRGIGQSGARGSSVFIGFLAALVILALVFRTVAATVLPLACAAVALIGGPRRHLHPQPRHQRLEHHAVPGRADGDRRRRRLRAVHRHATSSQPAPRHVRFPSRSPRRSTPPGARCCSPAPPCASPSSDSSRSA